VAQAISACATSPVVEEGLMPESLTRSKSAAAPRQVAGFNQNGGPELSRN
jgi:hypothetical protein